MKKISKGINKGKINKGKIHKGKINKWKINDKLIKLNNKNN